jgi:epoxyqueuosine reductase
LHSENFKIDLPLDAVKTPSLSPLTQSHGDGIGAERAIKKSAIEIGFDLVGVAPVDVAGDLDFAKSWVEQGRGGEMNYLRNPKRHDPRRVLPSVQSVVCVGLIYNSPLPYSTEVHVFPSRADHRHAPCADPEPDSSANSAATNMITDTAWISRYAWGRDYHKVMRKKLESLRSSIQAIAPGVETRVYADTGPIVERVFARYSGIGWVGKNTCLIHPEKGSCFFLGVILTSLALRPDLPAADRCGSCRRCIDACPTGALDAPYAMDASRCIAYFTIELKESIPAGFRPALGVNVFGCDICQDVCPWNSPRPKFGLTISVEEATPNRQSRRSRLAITTSVPEFNPQSARMKEPKTNSPEDFSFFNPPLAALAAMTEEDFRRIFRDMPMKRAKFRGFMRNLCVALGNCGNPKLLPAALELSAHPDPLIREHALWACDRLKKCEARAVRDL